MEYFYTSKNIIEKDILLVNKIHFVLEKFLKERIN